MAEEEEESGGGGAGWLVSFADLMTLLFAAFVVLYGITPSGESDEILGVMASVRESFVEVSDDIPDGTAQNALLQGKISFKSAIRESFENPAIKKFNRESNPLKTKQLHLDRVDVDKNEKSKGDNIHENLRKAEKVAKYEIAPEFRRIETVFFAKNAKELSLEGKEVLRLISDELRNTKMKIYLEGHTGKTDTQKAFAPLLLSNLRAEAVKKFLVSQIGIPPSRILTAAYGDLRPFARKGKDSRVEIKVKQD